MAWSRAHDNASLPRCLGEVRGIAVTRNARTQGGPSGRGLGRVSIAFLFVAMQKEKPCTEPQEKTDRPPKYDEKQAGTRVICAEGSKGNQSHDPSHQGTSQQDEAKRAFFLNFVPIPLHRFFAIDPHGILLPHHHPTTFPAQGQLSDRNPAAIGAALTGITFRTYSKSWMICTAI